MGACEDGVKRAKATLGIGPQDEEVKKRTRFAGMPVNIEFTGGSTRYWHDDKGKVEWQHTFKHDYGHFPQVIGADGDHLDVYVGPHDHKAAPTVFVLDKRKKDGKTFDEHKVFVGFKSPEEIRSEVTDGWKHPSQVGKFREMSLADLKAQVRAGKFTPPK